MKGTSKVIMGATLVLVVSLAMVLSLILVLLAELYCSLLLRRRRLRATAATTATTEPIASAAAATSSSSSSSSDHHDHDHHRNHDHDGDIPRTTPPLSSFYAQGVLQAPRSLLFPAVTFEEDRIVDAKKQKKLSELCHRVVIDIPTKQIESISTPSPSSTVINPSPSPNPTQENDRRMSKASNDKQFVYISNPMYENAENRVCSSSGPNTPFETPDSSPSRLEEMDGNSSGEDDEVGQSTASTPPLNPMKKLPAEASSVSLRDASSLVTNSGSDSNTHNGLSSSSSGSPCTSPSW